MRCRTDDVAAHATEELHRLGANQRQVDFNALLLPVGDLTDHAFEQVGIEAAAKTTVGRNHDQTDSLYFTLDQERVLVVRVGVGKVADHTPNAFCIRA